MINNCHHGEAFLWSGTGIDEVDDAIMDLIKISEISQGVAIEMSDEISSILSKLNSLHNPEDVKNEQFDN